MDIVFFGSSQFAVPSLKAIIKNGCNISCVVTQPDRKKGRGLHLEGTVVKSAALEYGLKIHLPERINSAEQVKFLKNLKPDIFVVISYGQILAQEILDIPNILAVNAHASFLPGYRGAAPINWALIKGEETTGVTIIKMTKEMDSGPIIMQERAGIDDDDTAKTLEDRLSQTASQLLISSLKLIEGGKYDLTEQDEKKATFAPKLKKEDGLINWKMAARDIYNLIRGCAGWPGAFTFYKGRLFKIHKVKISSQVRKFVSSSSGEIMNISKEGIVIAIGKDNLIIEELQIEGERRMKVGEFIAGHKILPGEILGPDL